MNIGELRDRIIIQHFVRTPDGAGGFDEEWIDTMTIWANVIPQMNNEKLVADRIAFYSLYNITVRYRTDITTDMRILFSEKPLNILSVVDLDGKRRWLSMICQEVSL